jgi:acetyltransferase-like isoleucine patch superfamily enzyme
MLTRLFFKLVRYMTKVYWRQYALHQLDGASFDRSSVIFGPDVSSHFTFLYPTRVSIGAGTVINGRVYINAEGGVSIGNWCHFAQGLTIYSSNHNWLSKEAVPYSGPNLLKPVLIGDAVWIGANVTILPGTQIGDGAIISAGSVVRGTISPGAVMAGNPATKVAERDIEQFYKLLSSGACL